MGLPCFEIVFSFTHRRAPCLLVKRVENIKESLMKEIRYLDLLIDELARGKSMEKILRES
jgi:hypothetical protein